MNHEEFQEYLEKKIAPLELIWRDSKTGHLFIEDEEGDVLIQDGDMDNKIHINEESVRFEISTKGDEVIVTGNNLGIRRFSLLMLQPVNLLQCVKSVV